MKITDLNLLEIDLYDGDKIIYSGMCNEAPDELKELKIKIDRIDGKKLILRKE